VTSASLGKPVNIKNKHGLKACGLKSGAVALISQVIKEFL